MTAVKPRGRNGGRKAGVPNKKNAKLIEGIEQTGLTPLAYMLNVMRDEAADPAMRNDMAKAAAPYVHPKLATIENKITGKLEVTNITRKIIDPKK